MKIKKTQILSLKRLVAVAVVSTGIALMAVSCAPREEAQNPPPGSPQSPVAKVNAKMADKVNEGPAPMMTRKHER